MPAAILNAAVVLIGVAVIAVAFGRDRPDEVAGGVAIVALGLVLGAWSLTRSPRSLQLLAAIGALTQVLGVIWYYFSGFARDANAYHRAALIIIDPQQELTGRFAFEGSSWSNFMLARFTAGLYELAVPSQLLAFVVFASMGLLAKIVFAHSLHRLRPALGRSADVAALGVMVFPSLALWLSPISKEAFAVLGIAVVIAGVVSPEGERPRVSLITLGILLAALTRPHVAMLLAVAVLMYAAVSVAIVTETRARRLVILFGAAALAAGAVVAAASFFDIDASLAGFGDVREDLASLEEQGGASIEARPVTGPADIPAATANVLLRPFIFEARSVTMLLQALETTAILLLVVWLLFQGRRRRANRVVGAARQHIRTLRVFAFTYLIAFVYAFSGMYNLGLMSRQRIQVTLIILLLIAMSLVTTRKAPRAITSPLQTVSGDAGSTGGRATRGGPLLLTEVPQADPDAPLPASQPTQPPTEPVRPSSGPSA